MTLRYNILLIILQENDLLIKYEKYGKAFRAHKNAIKDVVIISRLYLC